ncbi:DUF58 domain-containing protein [Anaerobacillus alkaliphilus]|uniref:DUF58 domain-containing protein n=1 Tax=Anaerobacillus alkaliphilus TaxID=1548597 RepID=A0A4Q0VW00_9BACI|nr:DUF58 domain-containing protein [Anaerobacillus alkaliphilus]RXJ02793.1 DUF58 domain-containing protein [Anaerobacillus alkaliphilus]
MSMVWFIVVTILMILVQSFIFTKWGLTKVNYTRYFNKEAVFPGELFELVDEVSNRKLLPLPWLRLESKVSSNLQFTKKQDQLVVEDSEEYHRTLFSLSPFEKVTRRHMVACRKRGYYQLKTVSLTLGDIVGFNEKAEAIDAKATIIVYPELVEIEEIPLPSHSWLGDLLVKRWIIQDPFVTAGVRQYTYGDPLNSVNWNATARTGQLQVSKRDFTADHHLMIYLNFDETEDIWMPILNPELIETGISYAASIATLTLSRGIRTGFGCNSYLVDQANSDIKQAIRIEPHHSTDQLTYLYENMAKLAMDRSMNFPRFLKEEAENLYNTDILMISAIMSPAIEEVIKQIETQGSKVEVLLLAQETGEQHGK